MLPGDGKGPRQIHVRDFVFSIAHFGFFHVRNVVGLAEHGVDSLVGVVFLVGCQRICKIGQGMQPGTIHFFDDLHQEEWILARGIVVFQVHDDVLRCTIFRYLPQAVCGSLHVRFRAFCRRDIRSNARRASDRRGVNPLFAERHCFLALGSVGCVRAVLTVHRDVYDCSVSLRYSGAKLFEVSFFQRAKMRAPRLDFLNVEFGADVPGEIF